MPSRSFLAILPWIILPLHGQQPPAPTSLKPLVVTGKSENLIGEATTASNGRANFEELIDRPYLRRGELLEVVPGVVITQHSGDGKANQYFVRGFNLDHGNDFAIFTDGRPINLTTHAHGQGYADLNPLIPELVESLDYWKGPFHGQLGDLSTAGAARFNYFDTLPSGIASLTFGQHNYLRGLLADSLEIPAFTGNGDPASLTYALESSYYDGPWIRPGNSLRTNGFLKYFQKTPRHTFSLTATAYDAQWDSTDQIPKRLIESGALTRLDNLDDTLGGKTSRYSLMAKWETDHPNGKTHLDLYAGSYTFDLFSNFTYFLNDPIKGDQFEQQDGRWFFGGEVNRLWEFSLGNSLTLGLQSRNDIIPNIGLYNTTANTRTSTIRTDDIHQHSLGAYAIGNVKINDWLRIQASLRTDAFYFDVSSSTPQNSASKTAAIISPKLSLIFNPSAKTELYASLGTGFHSNDARGVTTTVDPASGLSIDPAAPLVRTHGYELGARSTGLNNIVSNISLFYLHSDSELIYIGDAGTTEPGSATERYGIEWAAYWKPQEWLTLDNEITFSEGVLLNDPAGKEIPGTVPLVINTGLTIGGANGPFGALRSLYFSERPLTEDGTQNSRPSWQVSGRLGYRKNAWEISIDVLNILGRKDNDIEYLYASQLQTELTPVDDIHLHPAEPRTIRLSLTKHF